MQSLAESAGWLFGWLLRNSAHAAVLGLALWLLELTVLRRLPPRWRYLLWLLVVARLLLPIAPESRLSLFNLVDLAPTSLATVAGQLLGLPSPVVLPSPEAPNPLTDTPFWFVWALALWLPGALVLAFFVGRDHHRLQSALNCTRPTTDPAMLGLLLQSRAVMKVRRTVELVETPMITSPAITGWWHSRVLLPAGLLPRLTRDEARYLFLHELAHVKRADLLLNWLLAVVQILHWFNPVIWLVLRRLLAVREEVCDDLVLRRSFPGANREYGLTLLRILEECAPRRIVPTLAGVLDDLSALRQRMRCIRNFDAPVGNPWSPAILTVVIAITGLTERHVDPGQFATAPLVSRTSRSVRNSLKPAPIPTSNRRTVLDDNPRPGGLARQSATEESALPARRRQLTERFLAVLSATLAEAGLPADMLADDPGMVPLPKGRLAIAQGAGDATTSPVLVPADAPARTQPGTGIRRLPGQPIPVVRIAARPVAPQPVAKPDSDPEDDDLLKPR